MRLQRFLDDYISLGKGAVKIPSAEIIASYRKRYDQLISTGKKFKVELNFLLPSKRVIVHIKEPSESVPNFYYDVLIEFNSAGASKLEECHIKIFSNCPSFVYTYAYVFYHLKDDEISSTTMIIDGFNQKIPKDRLLIKGTESKLDSQVLTDEPVVRNPYNLPLFDKSVYFAIFYILDNLSFNQVIYNKHINTQTKLISNVMDFDTLMIHRKSLELKNNEHKASMRRAADSLSTKIEKEVSNNSKRESFSVHKIKSNTTKKLSSISPMKKITRKK